VLLLAPTRELASQIYREATVLAAGGSVAVQLLTKARAATAQGGRGGESATFGGALVSTPMRLLASLRGGGLKLSSVELVVLDEADRLFELGTDKGGDTEDKGFLAQIDEILGACDPRGQRALFSATMGDQVAELVATVLRDPLHVTVGLPNAGAATIEQRLTFVGKEEGKLLAFRQLVQAGLKPPVLVFVQSKERAKELYTELVLDGINVDVVHADRSADQRDAVIRKFRLGKVHLGALDVGGNAQARHKARAPNPVYPCVPGVGVAVHGPARPWRGLQRCEHGGELRLSAIKRKLYPPHRPHGKSRQGRIGRHVLHRGGHAGPALHRERGATLGRPRARLDARP
jgi:hypothetical protein